MNPCRPLRRLFPLPSLLVAAPLVGALLLAPEARAQFTPGDLYVAGWKKTIYKVDPATWAVSVFADQNDGIDGVSGLVWHPTDALLVCSYNNDEVIAFDSAGTPTILWDATDGINGPFGQNAITTTVGGDLYVGNWDAKEILQVPWGGTPAVLADSADGVVHADGFVQGPYNNLYVANRDGRNVLMVTPAGTTVVWDTLPDQPMSIAVHPDGTIFVACLYGDIYKYVRHTAATRRLFLTFGRKLGTPVMRFDRDYSRLFFTSSTKGNLLVIDPETAAKTEVLPVGTFATPLGIEVVGGHDDIGILAYGYDGGVPGTGDVYPTLDASGHPVFNETLTLELRDFVGAGIAHLIASDGEKPQQQGSGTLYTDLGGSFTITDIPLGGAPGVAGDGDLDYSDTIGTDPALDGTEWFLQAYCDDPTPTNSGISLSNVVKFVTRSF